MSNIYISKPTRRWLFGGIGFHNSEATMTPIMSEEFINQRVIKCFREVSPTFSRVFSGFADWTKDAMDHFADYYDETFRKSGTLVYMVPGRMPMPTADFDIDAYSEKVASNLEYLIKIRKCTKLRYYCVTNELSVGNTYCYLSKHLDLFHSLHDSLHRAFLRHGLDIGLLAPDCSHPTTFHLIDWTQENMDEITADYCAHLYLAEYQPGELGAYSYCMNLLNDRVLKAKSVEKRFILGEFGIMSKDKTSIGTAMVNDMCYGAEFPKDGGIYAVALAEIALAVINSGTFAGVFWSMFDYPDPFIKEDGDTPEEKRRYEVARFSGHGLQIRYNKNGLIKWCEDEHDYSARPSYYTMGYLAKLFKKGSRVLEATWDDIYIRAGAVTNPNGSCSICIINWADTENVTNLTLEHKCQKPMRRYDFMADRIPENDFCDLQKCTGLIECDGHAVLTLPPRSVTFLTTDYIDRTPSVIENIRIEDGILKWAKCTDNEHCYYRVYALADTTVTPVYENQIASTVAEHYTVGSTQMHYKVVSVDIYGNEGK